MWPFFQPEPETPPPEETPNKTAKIVFWNSFQLPISYLEKTYPLSPTVAKDLELLPTTHVQESIYKHLLLNETSSVFAKQMATQWAQQITTDTDFLKDTQQIIQNLPVINSDTPHPANTSTEEDAQINQIQQTWEEITLTEEFKEKFNYLEFSYLEPFNRNSTFLECLNLIHLSTPIMSFIMFIFFIFLPIFLMLYSSTPLSIDGYVFYLATLAKVSFMGKMAKSAVANGWMHYQTLGMVIGCIIFYGVQFYNSYVSYYRFWRNVETVNQHLITVRAFVQSALPKMKAFLQTCRSNSTHTYGKFCQTTQGHVQTLESVLEWLQHVQPYSYSIAKCYDFGNMFQCYYELHTNRSFDASVRYATGFQGFWENIQALKTRLSKQLIACASFPTEEERQALEAISVARSTAIIPQPLEQESITADIIADITGENPQEEKPEEENPQEKATEEENPQEEATEEAIEKATEEATEKATEKEEKSTHCRIDNQLYGMYYPAHSPEEAVLNDCNLAENWIITGPNASGKTTYLKTVALNLIMTQQFGMGFYKHCVLYRPYTQFYTYLNIPDTSDRDSLFQAEVRRGKEILDSLKHTHIRTHTHTQVSPLEEGVGAEPPENTREGAVPGTVGSHTSQTTFLLMDELFSGTNHDDAVQAAYGFLCYLGHPSRQQQLRFLLTTHFVEICDKIESTAPYVAQNGKMMIEKEENNQEEEEIRYLYQFKEGISRLCCGLHILKQMDYPMEVMNYLLQ